jgi:hypothetical protein
MPIVKVLKPRKNFSTRTGRRSHQAARRAASYYRWGLSRQSEIARGEWYGPQGPQTWEQVDEWIREQSAQHPYTYKLILSTVDDVDLDDATWQRIMAGQQEFADWRLIPHDDTNNQHAHVIVFGDRAYGRSADKIMPRERFMPWWRGMLRQIEREEQQYQRERQIEEQAERRGQRQMEMDA